MTTDTIFFPISCTSPFTVAINTFPALRTPSCLSASMSGCKIATAFFMVRAVFTTCGKNIFPAPNNSPTLFIPSISGPSIISTALGYSLTASAKSSSKWSPMPFIKAYWSRFSTIGSSRHTSCFTASVPVAVFFNASAVSIKRSAASGLRFKTTSSIRSSTSAGISV